MRISAKIRIWAVGCLYGTVLAVGVCRAEPEGPDSLFARMGGETTLTAVVNDLIDDAASDPRMKRSFVDVDLARLKRSLVEQICALSGGGCQYTGDSMRDAHAGLGISQAEFYSLVQTLRDTLIHHGVRLRERNELLKILAPMKRDVVEK